MDQGVAFEEAQTILKGTLELESAAGSGAGAGQGCGIDMRRAARQSITGFWVSKRKIWGVDCCLLALKRPNVSAFVQGNFRIFRPGTGERTV